MRDICRAANANLALVNYRVRYLASLIAELRDCPVKEPVTA